MADGSTQQGNDTIWTEDVQDARGKIPRSKMVLGAVDTDGLDVSNTNPVPVKFQNEAISGFTFNGRYTLTTAFVAIGSALPLTKGILVKAGINNLGTAYVAGAASANQDTADANCGYPLSPGEWVFIPCNNVNAVFAAGTANDKIYLAGI